ncbi:MAG TPA: porin family protein [Terriglobales bacterium]|nr:porin family protein [Terriglobales bacterium]
MKRRVWIAVVSALLLNSFALAQTTSHFDLSGNVIFSGAKLANAPSASTQLDAFGWQTSGVTHLNRWLALTSQFGSSYASSNSLQLIGYTGSGTITHYSMLVGPRITIPLRGRVSPFIEGLAGGDRASTKLNSNGISVTGREMQLAYSVGGGAQVNLNRRFGVNVEAQYLNTEHTLAFTGWQPANFQISAGIVIRMFSRTPQIAERSPMPSPTTTESAQPTMTASTTSTTVEPASTPTPVASFQPPSAPVVEPVVTPKPTVLATTTPQPQPVTPAVAPVPVVASSPAPVVTAKVSVPPSAVVPQPAPKPVAAVAPAPVATAMPVAAAPVVSPAPRVMAQAQPQQQQPLSLGEYARRLREQKQRERQQQQQ